jgi:hypothetical protein
MHSLRRTILLMLAVLLLTAATNAAAPADVLPPVPVADAAPVRVLVAAEGKGYLETVDGYPVLHLKGTPEEMGLQHGRLLARHVKDNVDFLLRDRPDDPVKIGGQNVSRLVLAALLVDVFKDLVPERFMQEMRALGQGAGIAPERIIACNLISEAFHCSGFALLKKTTACGRLLHGRVLDYGTAMRLQDHAVLIIQEPDGRIPFVNVSYAGFIGSVTGMNTEQISIGEMGGRGEGQWQGVPMSLLVRMVLEDARTLDQAVAVFKQNRRTCEYYYVIADARADAAVGMRAVPEAVELVQPGQAHPLLPTPVDDTVLLSAGERYGHLVERVRADLGRFTPEAAVRLMDAPVAMKSNLHNALMIPADGVLYVANARADADPAWKQKYYRFDIRRLMAERPSFPSGASCVPKTPSGVCK